MNPVKSKEPATSCWPCCSKKKNIKATAKQIDVRIGDLAHGKDVWPEPNKGPAQKGSLIEVQNPIGPQSPRRVRNPQNPLIVPGTIPQQRPETPVPYVPMPAVPGSSKST